MYEEYLGENYHKRVRKILNADEELCPDSMIDASYNISTMKLMVAEGVEALQKKGVTVDNKDKYQYIEKAAIYYLAGILCVSIQSRIKVPPFNVPKYTRKQWKKKQRKCMDKGLEAMKVLMGWA
jgi:hypothetical protein